MASFSENLKAIRLDRNMSQEAFAALLGTSKQVISRYENSQRSPKITVAAKYSKILGVPLSVLNGDVEYDPAKSKLTPITEPYKMPLLGHIAAGVPIQVEAGEEEYIELPCEPQKHADACMTVEGDSMVPKYLDGDVVFVRYQDDVEDGEIAAVCIDDMVTLKRVYHIPNGVYLVSENSSGHPPMTFTMDDANNIHLIGLAVGYMRWEH